MCAAWSSAARASKSILRERPDAAMAMLATLAERISAHDGSADDRRGRVGGLPTGTVTFTADRRRRFDGASLGPSGPRWDDDQRADISALIGRRLSTGHGGVIVRTEGDALFVAFRRPMRRCLAPQPMPQRALAADPGRTAPGSCASGWGSTPARRTWPATTTAASTSTGRLRVAAVGPRRPGRRCPRRRPRSSPTRCPRALRLRDLGPTRPARTCRAPSASHQLDIDRAA